MYLILPYNNAFSCLRMGYNIISFNLQNSEIEDIRRLCSDFVVIDNKTSESVQRSVIDVLLEASTNNVSTSLHSLIKFANK